MEAEKFVYDPKEDEDKNRPKSAAIPTVSSTTAKKPETTAPVAKKDAANKLENTSNFDATAKMLIKALNDFGESKDCPAFLKPHIKKASPIIQKVFELIDKAIPYIQKAYQQCLILWEKLKPYKPELLVPSFAGLIMCFFGGSFLTLIAAVEAFTTTAYKPMMDNICIVYDDFQKIVTVSAKDDKEDKDGDGVADVLQISTKDLVQRKVVLFMKTIDPHRLMMALGHLQTGFLAIIATLKLEFAKTITLANSIYGAIEPPIKEHLVPKLEHAFPQEYKKWCYPIVAGVLRSIIVSFVWTLQRINSALHSAIKGGLMCSRNILLYLEKMGIIKINHEDTYMDEIVGGILAFLGLLFQLRFRFALPFPLNILLFPFSIAEWFLMWMVTSR